MKIKVSLQPLGDSLPKDIQLLRSDATDEGYRFIERLIEQWEMGAVRFDKPDEALFVARHDSEIAGIGGVTADPIDQTALRMRRFYIRPGFRRYGIARLLAEALMETALKTGRPLNVNAGTEAAPPFWESLGFEPVERRPHTHVYPQPD